MMSAIFDSLAERHASGTLWKRRSARSKWPPCTTQRKDWGEKGRREGRRGEGGRGARGRMKAIDERKERNEEKRMGEEEEIREDS